MRESLYEIVKQTVGDEFKYEEAKEVILFNYKIMKNK